MCWVGHLWGFNANKNECSIWNKLSWTVLHNREVKSYLSDTKALMPMPEQHNTVVDLHLQLYCISLQHFDLTWLESVLPTTTTTATTTEISICCITFHAKITSVWRETVPECVPVDCISLQILGCCHLKLFMMAYTSSSWPIVTQTHPLHFDVWSCFPTKTCSCTMCSRLWGWSASGLRNVCYRWAYVWGPGGERRRRGRKPPVTRLVTPKNKPYMVFIKTPMINNTVIQYGQEITVIQW